MAKKPGTRTEFVLFDVLYEDGYRRVPSTALGGLDADAPARAIIEQQDLEIAERSGLAPVPIKNLRRSVVTGTLGFERVADCLRGATEFRQRVKQMVGRIEAMHLKLDPRGGHGIQQALQPFNVWRLLDRMDEALVPQPGGT